MFLAVFDEFAHKEVLEAVAADFCPVDIAPTACTLAKTDSEKELVATNAKLMFSPNEASAVDAIVAALEKLGFEVIHRHPVTSAGCPMNDRVILRFPQ